MSTKKLAILTCAILAALACTSRYRLDLFVSTDEVSKKVAVEQTEFVPNSILSDPYEELKVSAGAGSVSVLLLGTRWERGENTPSNVFSFDEYWKARLYIQFPAQPMVDSFDIDRKSLIQVLRRYDIAAEDKIYLPVNGFIRVDSVQSEHLFVSMNSRYENRNEDVMSVYGQFKVKISD